MELQHSLRAALKLALRQVGKRRECSGRGLVVFDLETTHLIEEGVEEMEISCACAAWVPMATGTTGTEALAKAEWHTWWHKRRRME